MGHVATSWLLVADALAGNVEEVLAGSGGSSTRGSAAGSLPASGLGPAAAAVAMIHGLRGDDDARRRVAGAIFATELGAPPRAQRTATGAVFDAMLLLHHGEAEAALERLAPEPDEVWKWVTWIWLHWYVALRAEAAVLAGDPDARDRLAAARTIVAGNPVASAIVERAERPARRRPGAAARHGGGVRRRRLPLPVGADAALAGGDHAARGAAALADLGLAPMRAGTG